VHVACNLLNNQNCTFNCLLCNQQHETPLIKVIDLAFTLNHASFYMARWGQSHDQVSGYNSAIFDFSNDDSPVFVILN
jgi:hypothetical protein